MSAYNHIFARPKMERKASSFLAWFVVVITSLFFFLEYSLNNIFNSLEPYIRSDYHLSGTSVGFISSLYFYANIAALIPAGLLLDRYSPKKLLLLATVVCVISLVGISYSNSLIVLAVARFAMGLGGGFCVIGVLRIVVNWVPMKRMASASGLVVAIGMLGGFMVQAPMTILINHFGWRHALLFVAGLGVLIFLLILIFVKDHAPWRHDEYYKNKTKLQELGVFKSLRMVLGRAQNWLVGVYASLVNLPVYMLGALWGIPYLMHVDHYSNTASASIVGMLFLGSMVGAPMAGVVADKVGSKKGLMFLGAALAFAITAVIIFFHIKSEALFLVLFFILGLVTSVEVLAYPLVAEGNSKMVTSTSISVVSIMFMVGGLVIQPLFGRILSIGWSGKVFHGTPVYSASGYQMAAEMLLVAFFIAFLLVFGVKEVTK